MVDGAIVGSTPAGGLQSNTFLYTRARYQDFELSCQVKLKDGIGNSGVQVRSEVFEAKDFRVKGPQADIGKGFWGCLYGEETVGVMRLAPAAAVKKAVKEEEFNDYSIRCVGKHVTYKINGETMVDDDFDTLLVDGVIALQVHSGPAMEVTFKNFQFADLSKKP